MAKSIIGVVSSAKSDKTIVVTVTERKTHSLYHKQYSVSKKFMAHDEKNEAMVGDKVEIVEMRPISRHKHHKLNRVIEKPKLREGSLSVTKAEDNDKPASKSKKDASEKEES
jgi:small subunit ribosomal protein S17